MRGALEGELTAIDGTLAGARRTVAQAGPAAAVLTWAGLPVPGTNSTVTVALSVAAVGNLFNVRGGNGPR